MSFVLSPLRALAWKLVKGMVRGQFPQVQSISTQQLADWLESDQPPPMLIDVRGEEEYKVSHLPGACHLRTVEAVQQANIPSDATVVLYCSVGYRSAGLAQQLQAMGYTHVMNLEGSIFEWYNQGRGVVANQKPARRVHPYNRVWGLLLKHPTGKGAEQG